MAHKSDTGPYNIWNIDVDPGTTTSAIHCADIVRG